MKAHAKILKNNPLFSRFSNRTINRLTAHSQIIEYPRGRIVYRTGDEADALYLIVSGRCQAYVILPEGAEQILELYAPGQTFGERAVVSGDRHWATVKVITDCVLLRIDGKDVNYLFDRSPALARELVLRLVDQLDTYRGEKHETSLGRVAAFIEISHDVRASVIGSNVATALRNETGGAVLYVQLGRDRRLPPLAEWPRIYTDLYDGLLERGADNVHRLRLGLTDEARDRELTAPMISDLAAHSRYVLVLLEADAPEPVVTEVIEQSDLAYAFFRQTGDDLYKANLMFRHIRAQATIETKLLPIACLDHEERAMSFGDLDKALGAEAKGVIHCLPRDRGEDLHTHYARSEQGRFSSHVRRIAREIGRCRIGLALSSGGAKGFAYVGVIQVLEEHNIHIDVVAGTSMGAYVGSLWAFGLTGEELEPLAVAMMRPWAMLRLIDPAIPPRRGFIRGNRVRRLLMQSIGDAHFSDMVRELRVVATDLDTLEKIVFDSGEVAPCVQASIAMPGVFVPVELNGRTIIDGGIADPLPVDVLLEMGVERVIAVNTIPTPELMRTRVEMGREVAAMDPKHAKSISSLGQYVNYFAPGNILDIMMRGIHGAQTRVSEGSCKQADIVLRPVSHRGRWHDFANARSYVELGRQVAEAKIDEIKTLFQRHG